jgi:transcriptional regulator with XRE-family HTH domain
MKTDWKRILKELRQHGVSQRQIADHLQSNGIAYTKSGVEKLSQGKIDEPSHSAGQAILNLHQQKTRD